MRTLVISAALLALAAFAGCNASSTATDPPAPPQLPRDFQWEGRWIVSDLGIDVPFTWQGSGGNVQMIAGAEGDPIHFTNLIYDDQLYTLTYEWPDTVPPLPSDDCVCLGRLTLDELNRCLSSSRYVGAEILKEGEPRHVHHFRVSVVFGDSDFASNELIEAYRNRDLFLNTVNWLMGDVEAISIRPNRSRASRFQLSEEQFRTIRSLSLLVLPEALGMLGVLGWWSRRRAPES